MKSIQVVLLLFFVGTTLAATLRNQAVLSLGTQRDGCRDDSAYKKELDGPISQVIWWCFNGGGCAGSMDYVYITVNSSNYKKNCRSETNPFDINLKRAQLFDAATMISRVNKDYEPDARDSIISSYNRVANYSAAFRDGTCYCYAGKWDYDQNAKVYITVVTAARKSVVLELVQQHLGKADSENVSNKTYFRILKKSCTDGNWKDRICSKEYLYVTDREKGMSWSDFADEIAWIGDRNINPGHISFANYVP